MNIRTFSGILLTESLLFAVRFLLGMAVNLFITIPNPVIGSFFESVRGILVIVHIINGLVIVTLAIVIIFLTRKLKSILPLQLSTLALAFIILAIASGVTFLLFGQVDAYSYTMAIGFAFAVVLYSFVGKAAMQVN